jgi:alkaline phosphatase D
MRLLAIACVLFLQSIVWAQKSNTFETNQPVVMLGYVDFREATVWVMSSSAQTSIWYWDSKTPNLKLAVKPVSNQLLNQYYVSHFKLGVLNPGISYEYSVSLNAAKPNSKTSTYSFKTPELWRWRNSPPDFKLALGSCNYINQPEHDRPGKPYGDTATGIFDQIASQNPDLMLWMGDNIYLREPDWGSQTGINERYIHNRLQNSTRKLFTTCPNLAIWDDHDFGPNDANSSFYNKGFSLQAFKDFWPNPGCGINGIGGTTFAFDYQDAHFLMLDNRYHRTPDFCDSCREESILGGPQLEWLKTSLLTLPGSEFKIICLGGQFLNSFKEFEIYSRYEWERHQIIDFIYKNNIKNVVFLTGDRHFSELSMLKEDGKPTIYDFTVSPLTSGVFKNVKEVNTNRVAGSFYNANRSFGMLEFSGKDKNRTISFVLYDKEGLEVYRLSYLRE